MNTYSIIGAVGLLATFITHSVLSLVSSDIFSPIFSANWWYRIACYSPVWIVFLVVGLATGKSPSSEDAKPRRHWFRFSMRTLLIVVTVSSIPLGWVGWRLQQVRREQTMIAWVEQMDGRVDFDYRNDKSWWEETTDKWFGERVRGVYLHNKQMSDLSPLAKLKNLENLHLDDTQVSDLSPLAELKKLEKLDLRRTRVSDLSPLAKLKNLRMLVLENTRVSDLSPLEGLKNLKLLGIKNTQVSDEQVQKLRQALPNCKIEKSLSIQGEVAYKLLLSDAKNGR
jgi:hypothetical protein